MNVKWLRRIKVTAEPTMTKDETSKYSDLQPDGRSLLFTFPMEVKSVITSPSGRQKMQGPGLYQISGLAWSGFGRIRRVEVSADGGKSLGEAALDGPVLPKALTRFRMPWRWNGGPSVLQSRAVDETGAVQPTRAGADRRARRAVPLSLQRDPELERRGGGRDQQCLCVSARSRLARSRCVALARVRHGAGRPGPRRAGHAGANRGLGHQHRPRRRGSAAGLGHRRGGQGGVRGEVPRVPRRRRRGPAERSARRRAGHDRERRADAHGRQLLAVRDDGVRLHPPCDAVRAAAVADATTRSTR